MKLTELGIVSDTDSSLYGYHHIFYAVENGTSDTISAGLEYNSLSINGYMTDYEVNVFVKAMVAGGDYWSPEQAAYVYGDKTLGEALDERIDSMKDMENKVLISLNCQRMS